MRTTLWMVLAILACGLGWSQTPFDASTLAPPANLVSNPSFEASCDGRPRAYDLFTMPQYLQLSTEQALHGCNSMLADVPAGATVEAAARQDVPVRPECTYEFSAWVKITEDRGGQARLMLQMRSADLRVLAQEQATLCGASDSWRQMVVRLKAPKDAALVTIGAPSVAGGMKVFYDALRLSIVSGPSTQCPAPLAQQVQLVRTEPTWVALHWVGPPGEYEVSYRNRCWPPNEWIAYGTTSALSYSMVALQYQTEYQFRVRYLWPEYYDPAGQVASAPVEPPPSPVVTATTLPWQARTVGVLRIWPPLRLNTFPTGQRTPRIVNWKGSLYVIESYRDAIYLSKIRACDFRIESTRELIPARTDPPAQQVVSDAVILGDRLYVMINLQETCRPGYRITDSREVVYDYDLELQRMVADPFIITGTTAGAGTWQGGLAVYRQQVWAVWSEVLEQEGQSLTRLAVAPITDNVIGEVHTWLEAPSQLLRDPALRPFGEDLLLLFSDRAPNLQRPGYEPLSLVHFNSVSFHDLRKIADLGRNSDPRGTQLGPDFYLFYSTDLPWVSYDGQYQDLRLSTLQSDAVTPETITLLDDMKYSTAVDATALGNSLYVVHEKLEHEPTDPAAPPRSYGTFISRVDVGPPSAELGAPSAEAGQ